MDSKIILVFLGVVGVMASAAPFSAVSEIQSGFELRRSLQDVVGTAVVIRFYSHHCGACQADAYQFDKLLAKYFQSSIQFYEVDVNQYPELVQTGEIEINSVPTYIVKKRSSPELSTFHRAQDVDNLLQQ